jgi:hypothetical protein
MCATVGYGLIYYSGGEVRLQGYTDSNWAWSIVDRKSTLGCCFNLGSTMISWFSRKQNYVALSTTEAKYIIANVVSHEVVWLQKILAGLFDQELEPTIIHCDNQICVRISKNPIFHDKSNHIEIKYHFI